MSEDLAKALRKAAQRVDAGDNLQSRRPRDEDGFIVALARAFGEDAASVLDEFHRNSALARLCRKILCVNISEPFSSDERTHFVCHELRRKGLKGEALWEAAAQRLNAETDATGRRTRNLDPKSIKPIDARGRKIF